MVWLINIPDHVYSNKGFNITDNSSQGNLNISYLFLIDLKMLLQVRKYHYGIYITYDTGSYTLYSWVLKILLHHSGWHLELYWDCLQVKKNTLCTIYIIENEQEVYTQ